MSNSETSCSFFCCNTSFSFFNCSSWARRSDTLAVDVFLFVVLTPPVLAAIDLCGDDDGPELDFMWLAFRWIVASFDGLSSKVALSFEVGLFFGIGCFYSVEVSLAPFLGDFSFLFDLWLLRTGWYFWWTSRAARSWFACSFKAAIYLSFWSFTSCRLSIILSCISLSFFIMSHIRSFDSSFCSYWFTWALNSFNCNCWSMLMMCWSTLSEFCYASSTLVGFDIDPNWDCCDLVRSLPIEWALLEFPLSLLPTFPSKLIVFVKSDSNWLLSISCSRLFALITAIAYWATSRVLLASFLYFIICSSLTLSYADSRLFWSSLSSSLFTLRSFWRLWFSLLICSALFAGPASIKLL